ncbi:hypothetical protein K501DRAFT_329161 [Backusella circina FSU 941]|nr:hypothetical protein K501DRAFT_329161 [Backusella circina FSU 941]
MSTFVFAPNWVMYPNNPKLAKEVEFPSLGHTHTPTLHNKTQDNVWSNPLLLQKIHSSTLSATEKYDEEELDEKKLELERLKALVPKTKKSLSNKHHHHQQTTKVTSSKTASSNSTKLTTSSSSSSASSTSTTPVLKAKVSSSLSKTSVFKQPIQYVTEAEKVRFIQFIKLWTRPGVPCHHSGSVAAVGYKRPLYNQEYALF